MNAASEGGELIHEGFSSVFRVPRTSFDGAPYGSLSSYVAVKIVDSNANRPPHNVCQEVALLSRLSEAAGIVKLLAYTRNPDWRLQMPYYPVTLADLLKHPDFPPEDSFDAVIWSICRQTCTSLASLEVAEVAHRDVKPANFLVGPRGTVVLADFDVAYDVRSPPPSEPADRKIFDVGTGPYKPPELLFGSRDYDAQALDLWALGATLAELFRSSTQADDSDDHEDWRGLPAFMRPKRWQREPLFGSYLGDIALIGRIYRLLGTPTKETWLEAALLPDFDKLAFKHFEKQPLQDSLPLLTKCRFKNEALALLDGLLVYSSADRRSACVLLCSAWLSEDRELEEAAARAWAACMPNL